MFFLLRPEAQLVDVIDDLTQIVAALNLVSYFPENLPDLIFDRVGPRGFQFESMQVRKEFLIDEIPQIVAGHRGVVVELTVLPLRRGPRLPAIRLVEDVCVLLSVERRLGRFVLLKTVKVFEKEQPRRLLGVIELGRASGLFPENVINILEGLFKHGPLVATRTVRSLVSIARRSMRL